MGRVLELPIRPKVLGAEAEKSLKRINDSQKALGTEQRKQDKEAKERADRIKKFLEDHQTGIDKLRKSVKEFGRDAQTAFQIGPLKGINFLQNGVEKTIKSMLNLKTLLLGSAVGYGAYHLASSALGKGKERLAVEGKLRREFGGATGETIRELAKKTGLRSGFDEEQSAEGIIAFARAIKDTTVGSALPGGRKIRTEAEAQRIRDITLKRGAGFLERITTIDPNASPTDVGLMLADAGTGPEGLRRLASTLHLGRAQVADIKELAKKKGLGQGDVIDLMLQKVGFTEQAAAAKRKTFSFQQKSIGAQFEGVMGDIGVSAMSALNKKFGEGKTLAEKLKEAIESKKGQETIESLGKALAKVVTGLAEVAQKIPSILSWIEEHKGTLLAVGAAWGGLKVAGAFSGAGGLARAAGAGKFADVTDSISATPVRVVNFHEAGMMGGPGMPGKPGGAGFLQKLLAATGAGIAGYEVGGALDSWLGVSDTVSGLNYQKRVASNQAAQDENLLRARQALRGLGGGLSGDARTAFNADVATATGFNSDDKARAQALAHLKTLAPNIAVNIDSIGATIGMTPKEIARQLSPHLENEIADSIRRRAGKF